METILKAYSGLQRADHSDLTSDNKHEFVYLQVKGRYSYRAGELKSGLYQINSGFLRSQTHPLTFDNMNPWYGFLTDLQELVQPVGIPSATTPFYELIYSNHVKGVIGAEASVRITAAFKRYLDRARLHESRVHKRHELYDFYQNYEAVYQLFSAASMGGAVVLGNHDRQY